DFDLAGNDAIDMRGRILLHEQVMPGLVALDRAAAEQQIEILCFQPRKTLRLFGMIVVLILQHVASLGAQAITRPGSARDMAGSASTGSLFAIVIQQDALGCPVEIVILAGP